MRGCYESLLVNTWNQTIIRWYRWFQRDSCETYNSREILQLQNGHSPSNKLHICVCYGEGCNGSPRLSGSEKDIFRSPAQLTSLGLFLLTLTFDCYS
jgi:Caenorhabditis elegans ly-6-related protein